MVATGQEMGVEKSSSRSGKSQGISLQIKGKFNSLKEVGESEILMVHINFLLSPLHSLFSKISLLCILFHVVLVQYFS